MNLDDGRWADLRGGYGKPYDPRRALRQLETGDPEAAWHELWENLHHQGDVGEASYAAVPQLVMIHARRGVADWQTYALAATIEECRQNQKNPQVPDWLMPDYEAAWRDLQSLALTEFKNAAEDALIHSILAVLAFAKGRTALGTIALLSEDERKEMLDQSGWG